VPRGKRQHTRPAFASHHRMRLSRRSLAVPDSANTKSANTKNGNACVEHGPQPRYANRTDSTA
jgi:hypothetical protein